MCLEGVPLMGIQRQRAIWLKNIELQRILNLDHRDVQGPQVRLSLSE